MRYSVSLEDKLLGWGRCCRSSRLPYRDRVVAGIAERGYLGAPVEIAVPCRNPSCAAWRRGSECLTKRRGC